MDHKGQIVLAKPRAGIVRMLSSPWRAWILEVGLALTIAAWLGFIVLPQLHGQMELMEYRSTMQDLTGMVQAMPSRAAAQQRVMQLRVDAPHGAFHLAVTQGKPTPYETIVRSFWLPKGLEISEAPSVVTALPTGGFSAVSIVVTAPFYNRLFRLTTTTQGLVHLHEEPTL